MSRTLLKVAGEQNDPLRVKVFPHDFVNKPLLLLILLQKCIVYRKIEVGYGGVEQQIVSGGKLLD